MSNQQHAMIRTILLALEQFRSAEADWRHAVLLAHRLSAELHVAYVIGYSEVVTMVPGPPVASMPMSFVHSPNDEQRLAAEGERTLQAIAHLAATHNVACEGRVLVGRSAISWGELGRSCDLLVIPQHMVDFRGLGRLRRAIYWQIVRRSQRPVLVLSPQSLPADELLLFYANDVGSSSSLPWVARLSEALGLSVTVFRGHGHYRDHASSNECCEYLANHGITAHQGGLSARQALQREASKPDSRWGESAVLAFDRGFGRGFCLGRRRRLVMDTLMSQRRHVLLCP